MRKSILTITTLCVGIIIGLMIGTSTGSLAAATDKVEAVFAKFSLSINGAESVEIEPLTYKGTTYLQVREVSNMLGYDVTYKADSRTIELNNVKETPIEKRVLEGNDIPVVTPVVNEASIDDQIKMINSSIDGTKRLIEITTDLVNDPYASEAQRESDQKMLDLNKRTLEELKLQKAELEAQLK